MAELERNVSRMPERTRKEDIPVRGGGPSGVVGQWFDRMARRMMAPWSGGRRGGEMMSPEERFLGRDPFEMLESAFTGMGMDSLGRADLSETEDAYELQVDLPGVSKDNVSVDYSDGMLTISGERHDENDDRRKGYYLSERSYGAYQRSFRVPDSVEHDQISAEFNDGVLTVKLPKNEEAQQTSRRIEVQ